MAALNRPYTAIKFTYMGRDTVYTGGTLLNYNSSYDMTSINVLLPIFVIMFARRKHKHEYYSVRSKNVSQTKKNSRALLYAKNVF